MEDRYSVLIRLRNQLDADAFYCSFNGKKFRPSEVIYPIQMEYLDTEFCFYIREFQAEVCHIYFSQSVEYTESALIATTPPPGFTELPTCPICLGELCFLSIMLVFLVTFS